jgi:hypothetical protein
VTLTTATLPDFPSAGATGVLDLDSALDAIAITSLDGDVTVAPGFQIKGSDQSVFLSANGGSANVFIEGPAALGGSTVALPYGKLYVYAGTDAALSNQATVQVEEVRVAAVHDIKLDQSDVKARSLIEMIAQNGITIQNSSSLRALANTESPAVFLEAQGPQGDILISQSQLAGDSIRARTLGIDGRLLLGNTSIDADQLVHLYAQGSNGQIQFTGDVSIDSPQTVLAAKKVTIDNGVNVTIQQPAGLDIFTDVPQFNTGGFGNFVDGGSVPITFTPGDNLHVFDSPLKPSF